MNKASLMRSIAIESNDHIVSKYNSMLKQIEDAARNGQFWTLFPLFIKDYYRGQEIVTPRYNGPTLEILLRKLSEDGFHVERSQKRLTVSWH